MRLAVIALAASALLVGGCIESKTGMLFNKQPTQEELASWDFGQYPANYKQLIENHEEFQTTSLSKVYIEYQGKPEKTWIPDRIGSGFQYGWGGFVSKSSHEVGKIKYRYLIRDGKIILIEKYNEKQSYW